MSPDALSESIEKLMILARSKQDDAEIASKANDDETLSLTLTALAMVNTSLGKRGSWASYIARNAGEVVKVIKEEAKIRISELTLEYSQTQPVGRSEHQAKVDAHKEYKDKIKEAFTAWSDAQQVADEIESLGYRLDSYLKMCQSRLSLMKSEKR